jgi:transposase
MKFSIMHASLKRKKWALPGVGSTQQDLFDHSVIAHTVGASLLCSQHAPKARCMMNARENRALAIVANSEIVRQGNIWIVPSQSRATSYKVDLFLNTCSCPDFQEHANKCKHLYAVELLLQRESGVELPAPQVVRPTYKQEWHEYNLAQTTEKLRFLELLFELCRGVHEPLQTMGRPRWPFAEILFCAVYKVYATCSTRRFISDLQIAKERGYIGAVPHFNTVIKYLDVAAVTPYLKQLIVESSLPLKVVEDNFAVDSSGFSLVRTGNWHETKWGATRKQYGATDKRQDWLKVHLMCGCKTNIVTSVEVTDGNAGDYPQFAPLVNTTARNFVMDTVVADGAYSGATNLKLVVSKAAMPYIPFKSTATGSTKRGGDLWRRMFHYFKYNQDEFNRHYHLRSNVETTFSMIKAKFGERLRSKTPTAQINEVLCKVLAHNLCCVIQSIYELGVEPTFWTQ